MPASAGPGQFERVHYRATAKLQNKIRNSHRKKRGMTRRWLRIKAECHNGSFLRGAQRLTAVSLAWLLLVGTGPCPGSCAHPLWVGGFRTPPPLGARSRLPLQVGIAIGSTCVTSCSNPASSADASPPTPTICAICSRGRLAGKRAMNSPCRSAGCIIGLRIAPAMSEPGGRPLVSIPPKIARRLWKQTRMEEGQVPPDAPMQTPKAGVSFNSHITDSTGPDVR